MKDNTVMAADAVASVPQSSQTNPPHFILMVEDDNALRELNTKALVRAGYAVVAVADGTAAWEALSTDEYDLMITDNSMPKLTGIELLKKLRAARMTLPVIMASGNVPQEEFIRHPWLLPVATLLKPYSAAELLHTVKKVLREADSNISAPWSRPASAAPRILVVDEDRDLRQLYDEALSGSGYSVDLAADGAAGWEALQAGSYHLLITENDLPNLTGVELVRKLRAARMALPVVLAATRLPLPELAGDPSLQLAATIMKPFVVNVLLETVRNVLRATASPREEIAPGTDGFNRLPLDRWQP